MNSDCIAKRVESIVPQSLITAIFVSNALKTLITIVDSSVNA